VLARDVQRTCTQAMLLCLTREERIAVLLAEMLGATDAIGAEVCWVSTAAVKAAASIRPANTRHRRNRLGEGGSCR